MDLFKALQLVCIKSVTQPDGEYKLRRILRWYSKTFYTPLHIVETLPLENILIAYFESIYEEMEEEERQEHIQLLLETDEQRKARLENEEKERLSAQDFLEFSQKQQKEKEEAHAKTEKRIIDGVPVLKGRDPLLSDGMNKAVVKDEEIKIEYVEDNNLFEDELDSLAVGPKPKKDSEW